jgi:hypothetical protein
MSLSGGHLDALLAAGATAEQIVALVKADMAEREVKLASRREKDADRQRRKRSRGVTRTKRDTVSPNEDILTPSVPPVISDEITPPAQNDDEPELKPEHVVEAWNAMADRTGLPAVRKLTPERRRKLQLRIRQNTIDEFTEAISAIEGSPFLRGENNRGWRADFDFLLSPTKFTKLTEGTYGR